MFRRCWARGVDQALSRCQRHGRTDRGVRRLGGANPGAVARRHRVLNQAGCSWTVRSLCRCRFPPSRRHATGRSCAVHSRRQRVGASLSSSAAARSSRTDSGSRTCSGNLGPASPTGRGRPTGKASTRQARTAEPTEPTRSAGSARTCNPADQDNKARRLGQADRASLANRPDRQVSRYGQTCRVSKTRKVSRAPRVNTSTQGQPSLQGQPNQQQQLGAPRGPAQKKRCWQSRRGRKRTTSVRHVPEKLSD